MESASGGGDTVRLIRGFPEVPQDAMTDRRLQRMLIDGGEWWLENLRSDNSFEYKYWPAQNRRSTEYNEVRHILAARDLADTWRYRNDPRYLVGSRRSMDWLLKYEVHDEDPVHPGLPHPPAGSMLFRYPSFEEKASKPPNQKLGTVAVALLGWVAWADATGSKVEDTRIRKMAEFVLTQLEDTGKFTPYFLCTVDIHTMAKRTILFPEKLRSLWGWSPSTLARISGSTFSLNSWGFTNLGFGNGRKRPIPMVVGHTPRTPMRLASTLSSLVHGRSWRRSSITR